MRVMICARDAEGRACHTYHEVEPRWVPADAGQFPEDSEFAPSAMLRVLVSVGGLTFVFGSESLELIMPDGTTVR